MGLIVQKFGGTSVATQDGLKAIVKHVSNCQKEGNNVVVVVSAMGRKGDPYATDTLIGLLEKIDPSIDPRKKDLIMSCGEIISSAVVAHFLDLHNLASVPLTGFQARILTNDHPTNSDIIDIDTQVIKKHLAMEKIVVIAGFQGITMDGIITTLGRGGSDTTAVELGAYLKADRVDIFTDVPGVALTDPRIVGDAIYLSHISYKNMYKLASNGTKVIHPRAVAAAARANIPVRVRSTFQDDLGTLIFNEAMENKRNIIGISLDKGFSYLQLSNLNDFSYNNDIYPSLLTKMTEHYIGIYYKDNDFPSSLIQQKDSIEKQYNEIDKISIFHEKEHTHFIQQKVLNYLQGKGLPLFDIFTFEDHMSIMLSHEQSITCIQYLYEYLKTIEQELSMEASKSCSIS
ncbi:MAG: aspartate kinase [Thermotaleaceae bacterium]